MPIVILGLLVFLPVALLFLLRSNGAIVFLALCAGTVLLKFVGNDASQVMDSLLPTSGAWAEEALNIGLLLIPALVSAFLLKKSLSGAKVFLNLLPAAAVGGLVALSIVPLLAPITSNKIMASSTWSIIVQFQDLIVATGVFISLLFLHSGRRKSSKESVKTHK